MKRITRLIHILLPPLAYLVLAIIFTWPLLTHLTTALGHGLDPLLQTWVLAWNAHALITDPLTIWDAPIFFPYPETLAYSDHHILLTVAALPLIVIGGPVLAYNLLVLASYVLTGWAVYLLASDMLVRAHDRWIRTFSSFAAGALFAFGTYRMAHFVHLQLLQTTWLPLALLFLRRFLRETGTKIRWRYAALFGLFTGMQCITALYYAYFTVLAIGLYVVIWFLSILPCRHGSSFWQHVGGLSFGGLLAALITIPLTLPYVHVYEYLGIVRSIRELENWSAPLQAYLAVVPTNWLYGGKDNWFTARGGEFALFPGFVTASLAIAGLILTVWRQFRNRKPHSDMSISLSEISFLVLLAACAFVLSLGVGIRLERGSAALSIPMPYAWFYERIPGFGALRVPARWAMLVHLALVLLASVTLVYLGQWLRFRLDHRLKWIILITMGLLALTEHASFPLPLSLDSKHMGNEYMLQLTEHASFPLPLSPIPTPKPVYTWLGAQRDLHALIELPVGLTPRGAELERITLRQFHQIHHWKPLAVGYSGIIPFGTTDLLRRIQRLPDDDTLRYLALLGINTFIIHRDEYAPETLAYLQEWADATPLLRRHAEAGDALVYVINPQALPPLPTVNNASIFISADERVPGVLALGLVQRWKVEGAALYGFERMRYYPALRIPQLGQVFDYGLLAADEDPLRYGFDAEGLLWKLNGLALYRRDSRLHAAIDLAQPVAGQFHSQYPSRLRLIVETDRVHVNENVFILDVPLSTAFIELDTASLVTQTLMIDGRAYTVPPGTVTLAAPVSMNREVFIIGQNDRISIQHLRVLAARRVSATLLEGKLAIAADCRFNGTQLSVTTQIGGSGALELEVRGASAWDDKPIVLLKGVPLKTTADVSNVTFSVDLFNPSELWITHREPVADGRYIVYLKAIGYSSTAVPIATLDT